MELSLDFYTGHAILTPPRDGSAYLLEGSIQTLAREIPHHYRGLLRPHQVQKPKGARGFSFHWSNAQNAWDVISAKDPTWDLDGAEFLLYFLPGALSPVGRPWSLKEMEYIAHSLPAHPGAAHGIRAASVAERFLNGGGR